MARGNNEAPTGVSPESETSGQANPMSEPTANPTDAQQEQAAAQQQDSQQGAQDAQTAQQQETQDGAVEAESVDPNSGRLSDEALAQAREDQKKRDEDRNKAVTREANPNIGGESFGYLKRD